MTDLATMHLKCLLEQATPGPWEYDPGEQEDERCIIDTETWNMCINPTPNGAGSSCSDYDLELAAHAPELAQEVINLRDALGYLVGETRLAAENSDDVVVQKRVADAIKTTVAKIQGENDE